MIRIATIEDLPILVELSSKFVQASPYREFPIDEEKLHTLVRQSVIAKPVDGIVLLLERDGITKGMIAGTTSEFLFSRDKIASEIVWYVEPGHRGGGRQLHKYFEYWAKNVAKARIIHMASLNTPAVNRYYERCGYTATETTFVKVI